ncbi:hypothetical protein GJ744_011484 [Endocarpon pusillum]|uniref:Uncharacterized protein n=1 Tax=Endocarpon pusillum TaxID=364733 RepID=A0A8H7ACU4_9EURO|nr:hypothetical protein GJ744_011484 [Endocarpon pusillum]
MVNCAASREQGVSTKFTLLMKEYIDETGQQMVLLSACFLRVKPRDLPYMASIWQDWELHIRKLQVRWFESFNFSRDSVKPSTTAPPVKKVYAIQRLANAISASQHCLNFEGKYKKRKGVPPKSRRFLLGSP